MNDLWNATTSNCTGSGPGNTNGVTTTNTGTNGTTQTGSQQIIVFSSPGTIIWTVPSEVSQITVEAWGGGGGGAAGTFSSGGGGGGGGGYGEGTFNVTSGAVYAVVVGSGSYGSYSNGGSSSFGSLVTSTGGSDGGSSGGSGGTSIVDSSAQSPMTSTGMAGGNSNRSCSPTGGNNNGLNMTGGCNGGSAGGSSGGNGGMGGTAGPTACIAATKGQAPGGGGGGGGAAWGSGICSDDGDAGSVGEVKITYATSTTSGGSSSSNSSNSGWDGWIELSGTSHASGAIVGSGNNCNTNVGDTSGQCGVTYVPSSGNLVGYAWGSNVVGWLSFNGVNVGPITQPTNTISLTCSGNPSSLSSPGQVVFTTTASGGTAPYYWNNSSTSGTNSTSTTVSNYTGANGSAPTFTVHDSSPTPLTSSISSCSIPVTTCPGGNCGGNTITASCSVSPTTLPVGGGTVTITLSNIQESGGYSGPFNYTWGGSPGAINSGHTASYTTTVTSGSLYPTVSITDPNGNSLNNYSCGSVTVAGGGPSIPELWPGSPAKQLNYDFSNNPTLTTHAHPGDSVQVSYKWSNINSKNDCVATGGNTLNPKWDNTYDLTTNSPSGSGSQTFTGLNLGIYTLGYTCKDTSDKNNTITTYSNPVEIDVTPSTVQEL
jgi:hypothetical protein